MPKTSKDVATRALRVLGVCSLAEEPEAEDYAYAKTAMDAGLAELIDQHDFDIAWTIEAVPDEIFLPFADFVAAEIASTYSKPAPRRSAAIGRMRASLHPDDREDSRDLNDDGTISDDEAAAAKRAAYY